MSMKKRGQFYLLAAAIIIGFLISLSVAYNSVVSSKNSQRFFDLAENLEREGVSIVSYGVYNNQGIDNLIQNFTELFSSYLENTDKDLNFVILTGDTTNVKIRQLNKTSLGQTKVYIGNTLSITENIVNKVIVSGNIDPRTNTISFELANGVKKNITINPGQNFIFVLAKGEGAEKYVQTNAE